MDCTYFQDCSHQYWLEQKIQDLTCEAKEALEKKCMIASTKQLEILAFGRVYEEDAAWNIWDSVGLDIEHAYAVLGNEPALEKLLAKEYANYEPDYQ